MLLLLLLPLLLLSLWSSSWLLLGGRAANVSNLEWMVHSTEPR